MAIGAILATALSFASSLTEQSAIEDQAEAQQDELTRQQEETNLRAQEDRSDRALEADRASSASLAAMEVIGGAGSANDVRLGAEIAGNAGVDLARIEGNRRREVGALQSEKKSSAQKANANIQASQLKFLGTAASAGVASKGFGFFDDSGPGLVTKSGKQKVTRVGQQGLSAKLG